MSSNPIRIAFKSFLSRPAATSNLAHEQAIRWKPRVISMASEQDASEIEGAPEIQRIRARQKSFMVPRELSELRRIQMLISWSARSSV